jgi:hypothetical protein
MYVIEAIIGFLPKIKLGQCNCIAINAAAAPVFFCIKKTCPPVRFSLSIRTAISLLHPHSLSLPYFHLFMSIYRVSNGRSKKPSLSLSILLAGCTVWKATELCHFLIFVLVIIFKCFLKSCLHIHLQIVFPVHQAFLFLRLSAR